MNSQLDTAARLLDAALKSGASAADVMIVEARSLSAAVRNGEVESVENEEGQDVGLRVIVDGRVASTSGNLTDGASFVEMAQRAVAMAQASPLDPTVVLANVGQFATDWPDLDLYDGQSLTPQQLIDRAMAAEAAGLSHPKISNSGGGNAGFTTSETAFVTSEGFQAARRGSYYSNSLSLITGAGEAMQRDYAGHSARHLEDLDAAADIGALAASRTAGRLGARPRSGGKLPVVFDPRVAGSLLGGVLGCLSGSAVARGTSFLKDRMGQQLMPSGLSINDDPRIRRGRRSRAVDAEGLATRQQAWIDRGKIASWIMDLGTAKQLGLESNACAVRGVGGSPSPSASNVALEGGTIPPQALIADIKQGLYVTEMMGQGFSGLTGDYSRGAGGFWIENGEITEPVSEMTVASNMLDMLRDLVACDDLERRYGIDSPTLMIPQMSIAGPG